MSTSLVADFNGPIAFRFCAGSVWAYLPCCFLHVCNVLTDDDDRSPDLGNRYVLQGPTAGNTALGGNGAEIICLDWNKDTNGNQPGLDDCYCIFQLPLPDLIYGLRGEYVSMKDLHGQERGGDNCARGLRFCYKECLTPPQLIPTKTVVVKSDGSNDLSTLDATCVNADPGHYRYEIRFHDLNAVPVPDNLHADADMCSATMRKLFPPLDQWTVNFYKQIIGADLSRAAPPYVPGDGHPVDCGANPLAFNDGGLPSP